MEGAAECLYNSTGKGRVSVSELWSVSRREGERDLVARTWATYVAELA